MTATTAAIDNRPEEQLIQLEKEWAAAGPRGDIIFFERIASENYVMVDVDGSVRDKQQEIAI